MNEARHFAGRLSLTTECYIMMSSGSGGRSAGSLSSSLWSLFTNNRKRHPCHDIITILSDAPVAHRSARPSRPAPSQGSYKNVISDDKTYHMCQQRRIAGLPSILFCPLVINFHLSGAGKCVLMMTCPVIDCD